MVLSLVVMPVVLAISTIASNRTSSREAKGATQWVLNLFKLQAEIKDAPDAVEQALRLIGAAA